MAEQIVRQRGQFAPRTWTPEEDAAIASRYAAGETVESISRGLGFCHKTIRKRIRAAGETLRSKSAAISLAMRRYSDEKESTIAREYLDGCTVTELAARHGIPQSCTVQHMLHRQGITCRGGQRRKKSLDESAFDDAERRPDAAYWVGMMYTDGCVTRPRGNKTAGICFGLGRDDGSHVHDFRAFLQSGHKVWSGWVPPNGFVTKPCFFTRITIPSQRLADALARYGVVPAKSLTARVRLLENNPDFWRGVICGDGGVYLFKSRRQRPRPTIGLTGSLNTVEQFLAFARTITAHRCNPYRHVNVWHCLLSGKGALDVLRVLFTGKGPALPRKASIAAQLLAAGYSYYPRGNRHTARNVMPEYNKRPMSG